MRYMNLPAVAWTYYYWNISMLRKWCYPPRAKHSVQSPSTRVSLYCKQHQVPIIYGKDTQPAHWIHFPKPGNWLSDAVSILHPHPFLHKVRSSHSPLHWHTLPTTRSHSTWIVNRPTAYDSRDNPQHLLYHTSENHYALHLPYCWHRHYNYMPHR